MSQGPDVARTMQYGVFIIRNNLCFAIYKAPFPLHPHDHEHLPSLVLQHVDALCEVYNKSPSRRIDIEPKLVPPSHSEQLIVHHPKSTMADTTNPEYVLWPYTPSVAGGAIAAIVFALLTCAHVFRLVKNRTWFCIPFVIGALVCLSFRSFPFILTLLQFETIGYAARAAAHSDTVSKTPYIIQSVLILIAPILFAASIYMILGRLIMRTDSANYSLVRAKWVTKIFVTGDVFCFFIQSGGAGMLVQAKDKDGVKMGENIILGGLILQILIFLFFVIIAGTWHRRLETRPTAASADIPWQKMVRFLYAASAFITIRNMCRVVEYAMGKVSLSVRELVYLDAKPDVGSLPSSARVAFVHL